MTKPADLQEWHRRRLQKCRNGQNREEAFARFLADLQQRLQRKLAEADRKVDATLKEMLHR